MLAHKPFEYHISKPLIFSRIKLFLSLKFHNKSYLA